MTKEVETTMKEQIDAVTLVTKVMNDANALSMKLKGQLEEARAIFERLREYQHPKVEISTEYDRWAGDHKKRSPVQIIDIEISRINAVLGDRA